MDSDSSLTDLSSDLSSLGSLSPAPDYPSPASSQNQEFTTVASQHGSKKRKLDDMESPTTKKRKRAEPKPRTTDHLDLTSNSQYSANDQKAGLDKLLKVLRKKRKIVVIAGAGISVSAGSTLSLLSPVSNTNMLNHPHSPRLPLVYRNVQNTQGRSQTQSFWQAII